MAFFLGAVTLLAAGWAFRDPGGASLRIPSTGLTEAGIASVAGLRVRFGGAEHVVRQVRAGTAQVRRARAMGPFRFGFLHTVSATDVEVTLAAETFRDFAAAGETRSAADLHSAVATAFAPMGRTEARLIGGAEVSGLRVLIADKANRSILVFDATHCSVNVRGGSCEDGRAASDGGLVEFSKATIDHRGLHLQGNDLGSTTVAWEDWLDRLPLTP